MLFVKCFYFKDLKGFQKKRSTRMGFEPTRAEPNRLAVYRLNHSATSSSFKTSMIITIDMNFYLTHIFFDAYIAYF